MIKDHFQSLEKEQLSQFRMIFNKDMGNTSSLEAAELLDENKLTAYLESAKTNMNAPNMTVAASLFSKRYSYLTLVPALYAMSRYNKFLDVSINNLEIIDGFEQDIWMPRLFVKDQMIVTANSDQERAECQLQFVQQLFSQHLNAVWDVLAKVGKVSKQTLWENTAVYIFWLYESVLSELAAATANKDFQFLLFEAEGLYFGNYTSNPLLSFYTDKRELDGAQIRIRKTCCLSYKISENYICNTCPKKSVKNPG